MADTKEFDVVRIARSDGSDTGPGYWPLTAPTSANTTKKLTRDASLAEKVPRAKPQMTRLAEDDPRFAEWRIKLGILLKQELSPNPDEGNPWYVHFPRGYWLYEKSKHLWVSGYPVKTKLFKSPQEFGVHLIWLLSTSKDYMDCCCVHCNLPNLPKPPAFEDSSVPTPTETPAKPEKPVPKVTPVPLPPIPGQPAQKIVNNPPRPQPVQQFQQPQQSQPTPQPQPQTTPLSQPTQTQMIQPRQPPQSIPQSIPQQQQQQQQQHQQQHQQQQQQQQQQSHQQPHHQSHQQPQQQPQPQPIPITIAKPPTPIAAAPTATPAQQPKPLAPQWTLKGPTLFRAGELVWYQTGSTWRLGIIAAPSNGTFELLPIGHMMVPQQPVTKAETDLRPFHCYSVPSVDIPELKDKIFDEVPWEALFQGTGNNPVRRDLINLDASKMAASKIDFSYSLWTRREDSIGKTMSYYGCFFGVERVEVGDALRIKIAPGELPSSQMAVLGLLNIFTNSDYPGSLFFRGPIYQLSKGPSNIGTVMAEDKLPIALREEIGWRNQVAQGQQWCWILVKEGIVVKEQLIRGRFYPTHRILPIANMPEFRSLVTSAQLRDQHVYLNNRMDGIGRYIGWKRNRLETLGTAVSPTARLSLEPHIKEEAF